MRIRTRAPHSLGPLIVALALAAATVVGAAPARATPEPPPSSTADAVVGSTGATSVADDARLSIPDGVTRKRTPSGRVLILPLPDESYALTSGWGPRCIPVRGGSTFHLGLDMGTPDGRPVYAVASGVVSHVVAPTNGNAGYVTVHSVIEGTPTWIAYVHPWNPGKYVRVGQKVKVGQRIADVGASGPATAPHLHLEVWEDAFYGSGTSVDPAAWLAGYRLPVVQRATTDRRSPAPSRCTYYPTTNLNMRTGPSTSYRVLTTLAPNTTLTNKPGTKTNGFIPVWAVVDGKKTRGWVHADYVLQTKTYHLAYAVTVRTKPRSTAAAMFVAKAGTQVTPHEISGGWRKVVVSGTTGWVPKESVAPGLG